MMDLEILRGFAEKKELEGTGILRVFLEKQRYNSEGNLSVLFVQKQRARESVETQRYGILRF